MTPFDASGPPFRILAAYSAASLAGVERRLPAPVATYFDLLAGTAPGWGGAAWWVRESRLLRAILASQADGVHGQVQGLLGGRYRRINFDIPDPRWTIDNADLLDELIHLGELLLGPVHPLRAVPRRLTGVASGFGRES